MVVVGGLGYDDCYYRGCGVAFPYSKTVWDIDQCKIAGLTVVRTWVQISVMIDSLCELVIILAMNENKPHYEVEC